jgi:hypothetical protein
MTTAATITRKVSKGPCSRPDCFNPIQASGLCNTHYVAQWREKRQEVGREIRAAILRHGAPSKYLCEGGEDCQQIPIRWWVKDGTEPTPLCPVHVEALAERFRREVLRLEWKP